MDETLQELENELMRLTPRRPSAELLSRLESDLAAGSDRPAKTPHRTTSPLSWKWATWSLAGMAVALLFAVFLQSNQPTATPSQLRVPSEVAAIEPHAGQPAVQSVNHYQPVRATTVLYDMNEEGPTYLSDQTEGRQVRYRYVDTYTWENPATNASLRWSVPRDEVRFVRASLD